MVEKRSIIRSNLNGEIVLEDKQVKLLGVTIDNNLNFNSRITEICGKVNQNTSALSLLIARLYLRRESQITTEYGRDVTFQILPSDMVVL